MAGGTHLAALEAMFDFNVTVEARDRGSSASPRL